MSFVTVAFSGKFNSFTRRIYIPQQKKVLLYSSAEESINNESFIVIYNNLIDRDLPHMDHF